MIHSTVLAHLQMHARQHDNAAKLLERSSSRLSVELAEHSRKVADDYRYLIALAGAADELISDAAEAAAERLLTEGEGL